jgi:hypothetical protein
VPFTRILGFQFRGGRTQTIEELLVGLVIRESATGKAITYSKVYNNGAKLAAYRFTNATTYSGAASIAARTINFPEIVWLKIEVTASAVNYYLSTDGIEWLLETTESDTAFIAGTIDQVGIALNCRQTVDPVICRIHHYS